MPRLRRGSRQQYVRELIWQHLRMRLQHNAARKSRSDRVVPRSQHQLSSLCEGPPYWRDGDVQGMHDRRPVRRWLQHHAGIRSSDENCQDRTNVRFLPPYDPRDPARTTARSCGSRAGTSPNCNRKEVKKMDEPVFVVTH